jgi:hypothetical protein
VIRSEEKVRIQKEVAIIYLNSPGEAEVKHV